MRPHAQTSPLSTVRSYLLAFVRSDAFPLFLLALLIIVVFYDVVLLGKTLNTSSFLWGVMGARPPYEYPGGSPDYNVYVLDPLATAVSSEPLVEKLSAMLTDFELPLWNSDTSMGRPLLGAFSPELVNPFRLPLAIWPSPEMWDGYLLARLWIAGTFTYLLAKKLGLSRAPALGAGVAYILSGYFLLYINTPHTDYQMTLPILLYSYELLHERTSPGRVVFASVATACVILSDNPEAAAIGLLYGGAYYLFRIAPVVMRDSAAIRRKVGSFALAAGTGIGLTAFVLIPFLELTGSLPGFDGYGVHRHTADAGIGTLHDSLNRMVSLFIPYFNGAPVDNFQHTGTSGLRNSFGLLTAFLALLALIRVRPSLHARWFFAGAGTFFIAKTYGVPIINLVGELPLLNVIDWNLYGGPEISLSVAMTAGYGIQRIRDRRLQPIDLALAGGFLVLLLGWFVYLNRDFLDTIPKSHLLFWTVVPAAIVVTAAVGYLAVRRDLLTPRTVVAAIVVLVTIEMALPQLTVHSELGPLVEDTIGRRIDIVQRPERFDPATRPPYVEFLESDDSQFRIFGLDRILYPNYAEAYELDDIRGFTATAVERYYRYVQTFIQPEARSRFTGAFLPPLNSERAPPLIVDNPLFDLTNVKYVMTRADRTIADSLDSQALAPEIDDQFELVYSDDVSIYENLEVIPRAFVVNDVTFVSGTDEALAAIGDSSFDPRTQAVVEGTPQGDLGPASLSSSTTIESYDDNEVRLRVETKGPGLLVLTDTYYPGWEATVDGESAEIFPANVTFRGVFLDEGEHVVEFSYEPGSFKAGMAIAIVSVLLLAGYAGAFVYVSRRSPATGRHPIDASARERVA